MHLKNIIALCFLFVAALGAAGQKNKAQETAASDAIPKPDASPESLKDADCSKFTTEALNKLTNMKACGALTGSCLAKFNVKGLCAECLGNIPPDRVEEV